MQDAFNPSITSGTTTSCWLRDTTVPQFEKLNINITTDVVIVGAGITGLSCAYTLLKRGKQVVVLDDGEIGSGETGRTTAHLANGLDDRYFELTREHGREGARLAAESHAEAINLIEKIVKEENIDCNFERVDGYLFLADNDNIHTLEKEFHAATEAGINVSWVEKVPVLGFNSGQSIKFPRQAQFHPLKYIVALAEAIVRMGGKICTNTKVTSARGGSTEAEVETEDGVKVKAGHLIVATNVPVACGDRVTMYTKIEPYRTYVITCQIPKGSISPMLIWDTEDPYHYVRTTPASDPTYDLLIVGGEDHKTGQAEDFESRFGSLYKWTKDRFPLVNGIHEKWSGQVIEPVDSLGYIGRNPGDYDNIFIVTGDSGNGLTHGTIASILIPDLIFGIDNPWAKLYDPSRKPIHDITEYVKNNLNVGMQYTDWLKGSDIADIEELSPCSGAVIRSGIHKIALYKDEKGALHKCNAVCPHLGAIVRWNDLEKSWDCPAHGSRFDPYGKNVNGPANHPLCSVGSLESEPSKKEVTSHIPIGTEELVENRK